mgnify:CR=1 FL=1
MRREIFDELQASMDRHQVVVVATVVAGREIGRQMLIWPRGETFGDLGGPRLNQRAALFAEQIAVDLAAARKTFHWQGDEVDIFFDVQAPAAELVVVGAVHIAVPLVRMARILGLRTVVIDPRQAFLAGDRFREADRRFEQWPQEVLPDLPLHQASALVVLSHDPKIDQPALEHGLRSPCRYLGALGSRKTHAKRIADLEQRGFSAAEIGRIHAPIGLDLGGRGVEEIALAILAEIVAVAHGRPTSIDRAG